MPSNNNCNNIQNRCHDNRWHFRHNKNVILVGAWTPIRAPVPDSQPGHLAGRRQIDRVIFILLEIGESGQKLFEFVVPHCNYVKIDNANDLK